MNYCSDIYIYTFFQFLTLCALVAAANAGFIPAPVAYAAGPAYAKVATAPVLAAKAVDTEYDPHPQYSYAYDVQDSITGDSKNQVLNTKTINIENNQHLFKCDLNIKFNYSMKAVMAMLSTEVTLFLKPMDLVASSITPQIQSMDSTPLSTKSPLKLL